MGCVVLKINEFGSWKTFLKIQIWLDFGLDCAGFRMLANATLVPGGGGCCTLLIGFLGSRKTFKLTQIKLCT